jgi:hypothetical protein
VVKARVHAFIMPQATAGLVVVPRLGQRAGMSPGSRPISAWKQWQASHPDVEAHLL